MKLIPTLLVTAVLCITQNALAQPAAAPGAPAPGPGGPQTRPGVGQPNIAQPNMPDPYTKEFHTCVQKSQDLMRGKSPEDPAVIGSWRGCFEAETQRQEAKMAANLARLTKFITADEKRRLDTANTDWRRYRNSDCAFSADPKGPPQEAAMNAQCVFYKTTERSNDLDNFTQAVVQRDAQRKGGGAAPPPAPPPAAAPPAEPAKK